MSLINWTYRRKITIKGSPGAGTGYQVLLRIGESSGSPNCDFHLNNKSARFPSSKNNSGDLRFTLSDGQTLLPFWVEKVEGFFPNRTAYVWVKINADLSIDQDIYCYYGNTDASNVSNGENTFELFDDFDGNDLDTNKWLLNRWYGSSSYSATVQNDYIELYAGATTTAGIVSRISFSFPFVIEGSVRYISGGEFWNGIVQNPEGSDSNWVRHGYSNNNYYYQKRIDGTIFDYQSFAKAFPTEWTRVKIIWKDVSSEYFENGEQVNTTIVQDRWNGGENYIQLFNFNEGKVEYDFIFVRKYTETEPTFLSSGDEEYVTQLLLNWAYRRKITISGSPGAGSGYQILLKIGESSSSPNCDFHLNNKSARFPSGKNDSGDLRFTSSDGQTLLDMWTEKVEGTAPNRTAYIWVKIIDNLDNNVNIYCYYGNNNANNISNGDSTFIFFDDFRETDIDVSKWSFVQGNLGNGNYSINGSILTWTHLPFGIKHEHIILANASLRMKYYQLNPTSAGSGIQWIGGSDTDKIVFSIWRDNNDLICVIDTNRNSYDVADNPTSWSTIEFFNDQNNNAKIHLNGVQQGSSYINTYSLNKLFIGNKMYSDAIDTSDYKVDWVLIRKYVSPEPAFLLSGDEEYVTQLLLNWAYRRKITIKGSPGAGTGYQVFLKVGESSGSSDFDFHLDNKSAKFPSQQNDSGDLRFTLDDGITLLPFWVEKVEGESPNRTAYVWVKVNADLSVDQSIYIYFGNINAESVSNGDNTFLLFDDFKDLDYTEKWSKVGSGTLSKYYETLFIATEGGGQGLATDGTYFYFGQNNGDEVDGSIYKYDFSGNLQASFAGPPHSAGGCYRPDNDTILFSSGGSAQPEVWEISKTGTKLRSWDFSGEGYNRGALIAYKGSDRIYLFTSDSSGNFKIREYSINSDGTWEAVGIEYSHDSLGIPQGLTYFKGYLYYLYDNGISKLQLNDDGSITILESLFDLPGSEKEGLTHWEDNLYYGDADRNIRIIHNEIMADFSTETVYLSSNSEFGTNTAVKMKIKVSDNTLDYPIWGYRSDDAQEYAAIGKLHYANDYLQTRTGTGGELTESGNIYSSQQEWTVYSIERSINSVKFYVDDVLKHIETSNIPQGNITIKLGGTTHNEEGHLRASWVFVRKYIDPEPIFDTVGIIEEPQIFSGIVCDRNGNFITGISVQIFLLDKDTGKLLVSTTSNSVDGSWNAKVWTLNSKVLAVFVLENVTGAEFL